MVEDGKEGCFGRLVLVFIQLLQVGLEAKQLFAQNSTTPYQSLQTLQRIFLACIRILLLVEQLESIVVLGLVILEQVFLQPHLNLSLVYTLQLQFIIEDQHFEIPFIDLE